jgi:hypothetical protein
MGKWANGQMGKWAQAHTSENQSQAYSSSLKTPE